MRSVIQSAGSWNGRKRVAGPCFSGPFVQAESTEAFRGHAAVSWGGTGARWGQNRNSSVRRRPVDRVHAAGTLTYNEWRDDSAGRAGPLRRRHRKLSAWAGRSSPLAQAKTYWMIGAIIVERAGHDMCSGHSGRC